MKRSQTVWIVVILVALAAAVYASGVLGSRSTVDGQQPSPHALDQSP